MNLLPLSWLVSEFLNFAFPKFLNFLTCLDLRNIAFLDDKELCGDSWRFSDVISPRLSPGVVCTTFR